MKHPCLATGVIVILGAAMSCMLAIGSEPSAVDTSQIEFPIPARVEVGPDLAEVDMLVKLGINIDGVFDGWARVYIVEKERIKLYRMGLDVTLLPNDAPAKAEEARRIAATRDKRPPTQRGSVPAEYHTYTTLTEDLQQIAADHPDIVRLTSIGLTTEGRKLWMIKISDNPDVQEDEPEFAYVSSMHGDEVVGKEVMVNLINYLTDNYGTLSRVTNLVDDTEIWIMPSMNPDGTEAGTRGNANGSDLNRNFPDQFDDPVNTAAGRQPETAAIMNWRLAETINLSSNFHGGALVANYPFDSNPQGSSTFSPAPSPDHQTFVSLARSYADNNPPMSTNSGGSFDNGITNGADWFSINGGMQDWGYVWHGGLEVLVEISSIKWPAASTLPGFWDDNLESLLTYMERVQEGIRGIVTDAETGLPLNATIQVNSNPFVAFTDRDIGDYHRLLMPGTYTLTVTAAGRESVVVPGVVVNPGPATVVNVALGPAPVNLQPESFSVLDAGNGFVDMGETTDLSVTLLNLGRSATSVNTRLISTGYDLEITRSNAPFPDIDVATNGTSLSPHYELQANPQIPAGRKLGFAVEWETDQGRGLSDPFFMEVGTGSLNLIASTDIPLSIPLLPIELLITSELTIPLESSATNVTDVKVSIDVSHTFIGDLEIDLQSPLGTVVRLHNHSGSSSANIIGTYGVDLTSAESLDAFIGENSIGTWTLSILDNALGDGGDLNNWSLEITGRPAETTTPELKFSSFATGPARILIDWWPYPGLTGYRIYRSTDLASFASFVDVTATDPDDTDTHFEDNALNSLLFYIVTGVGPHGEGPKGHFGE